MTVSVDDHERARRLDAAIRTILPAERLFVFDTDDPADLVALASTIAKFCHADRHCIDAKCAASDRGVAFVTRYGDQAWEEAIDPRVDASNLDILLRVLNLALEAARAPEVLVSFTTTYTDYVALVNAKEARLLKRAGVRVDDP